MTSCPGSAEIYRSVEILSPGLRWLGLKVVNSGQFAINSQ